MLLYPPHCTGFGLGFFTLKKIQTQKQWVKDAVVSEVLFFLLSIWNTWNDTLFIRSCHQRLICSSPNGWGFFFGVSFSLQESFKGLILNEALFVLIFCLHFCSEKSPGPVCKVNCGQGRETHALGSCAWKHPGRSKQGHSACTRKWCKTNPDLLLEGSVYISI